MSDIEMDLGALRSYLANVLDGFDGDVEVTKFSMGQSNPTYLLKTKICNYVLRRKPMGKLLKSAHAVDREFRIQSALAGSDVPVPKMYHLCEDPEIIGSSFYVMEHVVGRNFTEPALAGNSPAERRAVIGEMNRVLAELHNVDFQAVGLGDYGPAGNYYARQVSRWSKQYQASQTGGLRQMTELMAELSANIPEDDGQVTLVHGDFRIDNMIFDADLPACRAVLDWELSTLGHPYADLAAVIMQWRLPPGTEGRGLAGLNRHDLGIPEDEEFIRAYCNYRNIPGIKNFSFYLGFSFFRMAAILQGVLKRALDGNASSPEHARKLGAYVPLFAEMGLDAMRVDTRG